LMMKYLMVGILLVINGFPGFWGVVSATLERCNRDLGFFCIDAWSLYS